MTSKLSAFCRKNNIKYSISSSDMTYDEWLNLYQKDFKKAGNMKGVGYVDLIKDDLAELGDLEEENLK